MVVFGFAGGNLNIWTCSSWIKRWTTSTLVDNGWCPRMYQIRILRSIMPCWELARRLTNTLTHLYASATAYLKICLNPRYPLTTITWREAEGCWSILLHSLHETNPRLKLQRIVKIILPCLATQRGIGFSDIPQLVATANTSRVLTGWHTNGLNKAALAGLLRENVCLRHTSTAWRYGSKSSSHELHH